LGIAFRFSESPSLFLDEIISFSYFRKGLNFSPLVCDPYCFNTFILLPIQSLGSALITQIEFKKTSFPICILRVKEKPNDAHAYMHESRWVVSIQQIIRWFEQI